MKCIIGLGNPGRKYAKTRHNIGFAVIDELAERHNWNLKKDKFNGTSTVEMIDGEKVILLKPQTYMNLSGDSVRSLMDFYNISVEDVIIIYDDLDLPPGKVRLRQKGGHGGHNGIRSIIDHLGTKEFKRLRIGVGKPAGRVSVIDYVLGEFPKEQHNEIKESVQKAANACEAWITTPFQEVMNEFNQ